MKIVLIGFMGSGKSTIAPILAKKLKFKLYEMDQLIEKKAGISIEKILKNGGEIAFREFEIAIAKELRSVNDAVISTGGGIIMNKIILDYLRENALIINLHAPFETILQRIDTKIPRPLFEDAEKAKKLYYLRSPLYEAYADTHIATANKSVEEVIQTIVKQIKL